MEATDIKIVSNLAKGHPSMKFMFGLLNGGMAGKKEANGYCDVLRNPFHVNTYGNDY